MTREELLIDAGNNFFYGFVLVRGYTHEQLIELAADIRLANEKWIDTCWVSPLDYPTFQSIRVTGSPNFDPAFPNPFDKGDRNTDPIYDMESWSSHLIFPQQKPIILVIENFDQFEARSQYSFSTILGGESPPTNLHPKSCVIVSIALDTAIRELDLKGSFSRWIEIVSFFRKPCKEMGSLL